MGGGITWNEAWGMSADQRQKVIKFLNKKISEEQAAITGREKM